MGLIKNKIFKSRLSVIGAAVAYTATGIQLYFDENNKYGIIFFFIALMNIIVLKAFDKNLTKINCTINVASNNI